MGNWVVSPLGCGSNVVLNVGWQISFQDPTFNSLGSILRRWIAGSCGNSVFKLVCVSWDQGLNSGLHAVGISELGVLRTNCLSCP
jgi:hypothetical protein